MLSLKPSAQIDLEHGAYFLRGTPHPPIVIAADKDGQVSALVAGVTDVWSYLHASPIRAISPHARGQLALLDDRSDLLTVLSFDGDRQFALAPVRDGEGGPSRRGERFEECHFDEAGGFLWIAASRNDGDYEIQLLETASWSVISKASLKDPFGGSSCSFHHTGQPGLVALWLAAGQDGQQVYWLKRTRVGFSCTPEPRLENTTPPVFSPGGGRLLVLNDWNALCQYDFPGLREVGSPLELGDEADQFAASVCYLDERRVLAGTGEGRVFVVNTVGMRVEEEAALAGHEPRPIGEYYPTLAHESGLATDIAYFMRLGEVIVFVCRRDPGPNLAGWKDSLLVCPVQP